MKISVDASQLHSGYTGVGRYIFNIIDEISKLDRSIHFELISNRAIDIPLEAASIRKKILTSNRKYLHWANTDLADHLKKSDCNLFWAPNYYLPIRYRGQSLLTVHDISWKVLPDNFTLWERIVKGKLAAISIRKASRIVTVSNFSKSEIVKHYRCSPDHVNVIHSGIDRSFQQASVEEVRAFKRKHRLEDQKTIGFLGSIFKRRNIDKLVYSLDNLKKKHPGIKLLLVGNIFHQAVHSIIKNRPDIIWLKRIDEQEIKAFYTALDLFVFLSEYEGFGFPPLEALSCGTVPFVLNKSSLKELYGEFSISIDHAEVQLIEEVIDHFLDNQATVEQKIIDRFRKKKAYFDWKRPADQYISLFRTVADQGR